VGSNPTGAWSVVSCNCCVLSGTGLCDELITRPEESYRLCCVVVCDLETSIRRRPWPQLGRSAAGKEKNIARGRDNYSYKDVQSRNPDASIILNDLYTQTSTIAKNTT